MPFEPAGVSRRLLTWYSHAGRDLPWRQTRDPYRIWLSEIMLQQTTVAAVIPYYLRFLERFPDITTLAKATLDDVITLWAGLGYYSRARNLHQAAGRIVGERQGVFPDTLADLIDLPGIGRSTAGAILALAYDQPVPILDGNVRRVLVRLFAWQEDPRSSRAEKQLWSWSELLTPEHFVHDYTQAIMDLGATVCTPRTPLCGECPLEEICLACQMGLASLLPLARQRSKQPVRRQVAVMVASDQGVLLRQRAPEGFLGGLWEFPTMDLGEAGEAEAIARRLLADLGLQGQLLQAGEIRHAYSHFRLELKLFRVNVEPGFAVTEGCGCCWTSRQDLSGRPLHGAHKKAYAGLQDVA